MHWRHLARRLSHIFTKKSMGKRWPAAQIQAAAGLTMCLQGAARGQCFAWAACRSTSIAYTLADMRHAQ